MVRRIPADWRMVAGFLGLLLIIIALGAIGIQQIQGLSRVVGELARTDLPLQNAALEMKSANSKYAQGIRSYIFWRSAKYLDAAAVVSRLDVVRSASGSFDRYLDFYASHMAGEVPQDWVKTLRSSEESLRKIGEEIIRVTDAIDAAGGRGERADLQETLNKQLMDFESALFKIDTYLDNPIQEANRGRIERRLARAEASKARSTTFLMWSIVVGLLLGAQTAALIYRRSKREQEHREFLWRKVIRIEEDQRNNLSQQMHDQLGQDLSALKIYLGLIERDCPSDAEETQEKIEKAKGILDVLMDKAHNISELLKPPELDDLGLLDSLGALVLHYEEMTEAKFEYQRPPRPLKITQEDSLLLYRVAQEALTNIAKHSDAKNVKIALQERGYSVYLGVSDDGSGFDYREYLRRPRRRREDKVKLGLQGLRERIELRGGQLRVDTKPGQGTRLEVLLPLS